MKTRDRMKVGSTVDGRSAAIRQRDGKIESGTFREAKEGQPIPEGVELLHVDAPDEDGWREVTSVYGRRAAGPAQVATPAYRESYDRIFGKQKVGLA